MKTNLNKMCYPRFIEYLKEKGIQHVEFIDIDIEVWFTEYTCVIPRGRNLKMRFFDNDGGGQLFN